MTWPIHARRPQRVRPAGGALSTAMTAASPALAGVSIPTPSGDNARHGHLTLSRRRG